MTDMTEKKKKLPREKPGPGFLYLLTVLVFTVAFFTWVLGEAWYERINTPRQKPGDLQQWEHYKASVREYKEKLKESKTESILKKRIKKWQEKLRTDPDNIIARAWIIYFQYKYNKKEEALAQAYNLLKNKEVLPLPVLEVLAEEMIKPGYQELRDKIVDLLQKNNYPFKKISKSREIITLGLRHNWTTKDALNLMIIINKRDYPLQPELILECQTVSVWPMSITVRMLKGNINRIIKDKNLLKIDLPVIQPAEKLIFILDTDKSFNIIRRRNKFGVKVKEIVLQKVIND